MQGRTRTARPAAEVLEAGTYQMTLDRAFVELGMPKPEFCKKDENGRIKTPEESAFAQMCLVWKEPESEMEVKDKFLKLPEYLEFSGEARYKSKFQKRIENLLNKQLDDTAGNNLNLDFDFVTEWDELVEAIKEKDGDRNTTVNVKGMQWSGHEMFGREWLVTVDVNANGYNIVTAVAPLPKKRGAPQTVQQTAPVAQAAPQQKAPPARPDRTPPPAPVDQTEVDLPF